MYSDSQLNITTQVLEYDRGGGGQASSFSSNPPTALALDDFKEKRFRRGDINPSDGRIFWCYERDKRVDGSVHLRERWLTPQRYAAEREWKNVLDAKYMKGEAFKRRAGKRKEASRRWRESERGRQLAKINRQKPENIEKRRAYLKEYLERPGVSEKRRESDKRRYEQLKQNPEHVEALRIRAQRWQAANKKKYKESLRKWRQKHGSKYFRQRYRTDAQFAVGQRVRSRVLAALKAKGASKTGRTEELVGCSFDFLRQHIERQFKGKMSWDNPGSFHIDHIVPLAAFDLSDPMQLRVACNWQNLRPIPPKKNMSKGAKLTEPQLPLPLTVHSTTTYSL